MEYFIKVRSYLLYEERKLFKSKSVLSVWSSDGNILVRDKHEVVHRIAVLSDLDSFLSADGLFLASGDFCGLPIVYINGLDQDQELDPNHLAH